MKEDIKFYTCLECGNIVEIIEKNSDNLTCCGKQLQKMSVNSIDASIEKHVPVYEKVEDEIVVRVGEIEHPMQKDHYIMWIAQVSENRITKVTLYPEQGTDTRFKYIPNSKLYAYCNKHGLWTSTVK